MTGARAKRTRRFGFRVAVAAVSNSSVDRGELWLSGMLDTVHDFGGAQRTLVESSVSTWRSSLALVAHGGGDDCSNSARCCCLYGRDSARIAMVVAYAMIFAFMSPPFATPSPNSLPRFTGLSGLSKIVSVAFSVVTY
jgi:hypothetical protein